MPKRRRGPNVPKWIENEKITNRRIARWSRALLGALLMVWAGCAYKPPHEFEANPSARVLMRQAFEVKEILNDGSLDFDQKDALIREKYEVGVKAWRGSSQYGNLMLPSEFNQKPGSLYDPIISFYLSQNRVASALPYLEDAAAEARTSFFSSIYLGYQGEILDAQHKLGEIDKAALALREADDYVRENYEVDLQGDLADTAFLDLFLYLDLQRMRLQHQLRAELEIDLAEWREQYAFRKRAIVRHPALKFMRVGSATLVGGYYTRYQVPDADQRFYQPDSALVAYAEVFSRYGERALSQEVVGHLERIYRFNIDHSLIENSSTTMAEFLAGAVDAMQFDSDDTGYYGSLGGARSRSWVRRGIRSRSWLHAKKALVWFNLGEFSRARDHARWARDKFRSVETLYDGIPAYFRVKDNIDREKIELNLLYARIENRLGNFDEASRVFDEAIAWSETARESLPVSQRMAFFRSTARDAYSGKLRAVVGLYQRHETESAFASILRAAERSRSRQLKELLGVEDDRLVDLETIRSQLAPQDAILMIEDLDDSYLVAVVTQRSHAASLVVKGDEWDEQLLLIREKLALRRIFDFDGLATISRRLLANARDTLAGSRKLYVMTSGALTALPIGILPLESGRLLQDGRSIVYLPSLTMLRQSNQRPFQKATLLALGDPAYDGEATIDRTIGRDLLLATRGGDDLGMFVALPETREEVAAISRHFPDRATILVGSEASEGELKGRDLAGYDYLHFATHGVLGGEIPGINEPSLVLAFEQGENGFLTASEVSRLELDAELAVLSACNTGSGRYFRGEGLMGIGRAFMVAGSKQVLVSLWPVDSFATQALMESFYDRLARGESSSVALMEAQRELMQKDRLGGGDQRGLKISSSSSGSGRREEGAFSGYRNPYFWSPFILISTN